MAEPSKFRVAESWEFRVAEPCEFQVAEWLRDLVRRVTSRVASRR